MKSEIQVRRSCKTVESASLQIRISGTNQKSSLLHRHFSTFCFLPFFFFFPHLLWFIRLIEAKPELQIQNKTSFKHPQTSPKARKLNGTIILRTAKIILLRTEAHSDPAQYICDQVNFSQSCVRTIEGLWTKLIYLLTRSSWICFPFLLQASETQKFTPHTGTPHIFYTCNRENVLALVEIELI